MLINIHIDEFKKNTAVYALAEIPTKESVEPFANNYISINPSVVRYYLNVQNEVLQIFIVGDDQDLIEDIITLAQYGKAQKFLESVLLHAIGNIELVTSTNHALENISSMLEYESRAIIGRKGYAIFRDGVLAIEWHSGIHNSLNVIHIGGPVEYVSEAPYSTFVGSNTFKGVYDARSTLSTSDREDILNIASSLISQHIGYSVTAPEINLNISVAPNSKIQPYQIAARRCDQVVEYCYEYNGIPILGGSTWNICYPANWNNHAMTPRTQSGAMVKIYDTFS
ncbi:MAG: hypothetical protein ACOX7F_03540 [Eubacteriales bacterium]|jgi:hypothetical protein